MSIDNRSDSYASNSDSAMKIKTLQTVIHFNLENSFSQNSTVVLLYNLIQLAYCVNIEEGRRKENSVLNCGYVPFQAYCGNARYFFRCWQSWNRSFDSSANVGRIDRFHLIVLGLSRALIFSHTCSIAKFESVKILTNSACTQKKLVDAVVFLKYGVDC